jgi:splicing factor U2AF 65 kDa subunit
MDGDGSSRHVRNLSSFPFSSINSLQRDDRRDRRDRDRDRERRRSRSPRRHRDYEGDTYSSSRDYRERERVERHAGRHDDRRGWDREDRGGRGDRGDRGDRADRGDRGDRGDRDRERERGSRRDRREDERRRDRDREGFGDHPRRGDDRRGGGGGGGGAQRQRSASPRKKKEPTPDLTDIVSVLDRKRRLTQWDIKPQGYENVTAEQAKLSGMFPLPGAPRQQQTQAPDPSKLQALMNEPGAVASTSALKPSNARQSKRLFVYNLPPSAGEEGLQEFFNLQLNGLNVIQGADPCLSAMVSREKGYAMLEFRNPEDATVALALDGITMEADDASNGHSNGKPTGLKIQRPQDYIAPTVPEDATVEDGVVSTDVPDSPNKISISRIPVHLSEEQMMELLDAFGKLKAFVLVKDTGTEQSRVSVDSNVQVMLTDKGIAFCEYADPTATEIAVEGLNGMEIGDAKLRVQRASIGVQQVSGLELGINAMSMLAGTQATDLYETRVLQLLNMVTSEELVDNEEYEGMNVPNHSALADMNRNLR